MKTLEEWGVAATAEQVSLLEQHYQVMLLANKSVNLTRITGPAEAAIKHYADSLSLLLFQRKLPGERAGTDALPLSLLDVGTGAGFPAVPLAVLKPSWRIVALDGTRKKVDFVSRFAAEVGLKNLVASHGHSGHWECEEKFDLVVSRAVAALGSLWRLCRRFARSGGAMVAYKTADLSTEEEGDAQSALIELKLKSHERYPYQLHCADEILNRALYTVRIP